MVNDYLNSENMTTDFDILNKYISKHVLCVEDIVMVQLRFQTAFNHGQIGLERSANWSLIQIHNFTTGLKGVKG